MVSVNFKCLYTLLLIKKEQGLSFQSVSVCWWVVVEKKTTPSWNLFNKIIQIVAILFHCVWTFDIKQCKSVSQTKLCSWPKTYWHCESLKKNYLSLALFSHIRFIWLIHSTKVYSGKLIFTSSLFSRGNLVMSMSNGGFKFENFSSSDPILRIHSGSIWKYFFSFFAECLPVFLLTNILTK